MRTRTIAGCVLALASLAGAAGCSGGGHSVADDAARPVSMLIDQVVHKTDAKQSAQISVDAKLAGMDVRMDGTYAWGSRPGMDVYVDPSRMNMQQLNSSDRMEVRFVDDAYYYAVDPQPQGPLQGRHWMKISASVLVGDATLSLTDSLAQNPTAGLRGLSASKDVRKAGVETVDGKRATHYSGSFSKDDLAASNQAFSAAQKGQLSQFFSGSSSVALDVWVDDQDMPVRLAEDFGNSKIVMDFKSFGGTRDIQAPPASDTGDVTDAIQQQQQSQSQ